MNEECLICKEPLEYLEKDILMECALCHKKENSKTHCRQGHYICNACHTGGMEAIMDFCLKEESQNPIELLERLMDMPFCHMHGPEHHVLVGAALLTAYHNAGGNLDLPSALTEIVKRGKEVPGGACGFWGACGAGISSGMFVSILTKATPLAGEAWGLANQMTSKALESIGAVGGPRCCKRDSFLSVLAAAAFAREHFGVQMETGKVSCRYSGRNNQCLGARCPFSPKRKDA